jgi:pterin-4a-carbinolamine dehydratase
MMETATKRSLISSARMMRRRLSSSSTSVIKPSSAGSGIANIPNNKTNINNRDPTACRPNQKCDPYDQGGRPMEMTQIQTLRSTINDRWIVDDDHASIRRTFRHDDYLSGARFVAKMAAVAELQSHYPELTLDRVIKRRSSWTVETTVRCQTKVLRGLSTHDFHLAMVSRIVVA